MRPAPGASGSYNPNHYPDPNPILNPNPNPYYQTQDAFCKHPN